MSDLYGNERTGVLLMAHGAPEGLQDIPEFLLNVRGGRPLPEAAIQEIVRRYAAIGGGSPLLSHTRSQGEALARLLNLPVYIGMRNWKPFIAEALDRIRADHIERLIALCLAPQNSRTSIGLYRQALEAAQMKLLPQLRVDFIESWHAHPGLIAAFEEKLKEARARADSEAGTAVPVIFTAHSVPERTIADGDPYVREVQETAALVAKAAGVDNFRLAFQSQGLTSEPWVGPTVESEIAELAQAGFHHVLIAPIGFVADHVEILYDIDVAFCRFGEGKGLKVHRTESLNQSPLLIRALADLVTAKIKAWRA
ncbi:MAG: ferrochelatase [Acidobacteria bacterium]|nr:MAG: ferrochelatase [Acidobacteriota bacterium]